MTFGQLRRLYTVTTAEPGPRARLATKLNQGFSSSWTVTQFPCSSSSWTLWNTRVLSPVRSTTRNSSAGRFVFPEILERCRTSMGAFLPGRFCFARSWDCIGGICALIFTSIRRWTCFKSEPQCGQTVTVDGISCSHFPQEYLVSVSSSTVQGWYQNRVLFAGPTHDSQD
jgi:hypothetical protein